MKKAVLVAVVAFTLLLLPPFAAFAAFMLLVRAMRDAPRQPIALPYRGGSVEVSPTRVVAGATQVPVTITYTVGPEGIKEGGSVKLCGGKVLRFGTEGWRLCLQWANGWGRLQRRHPDRANYLDVTTSRQGVSLEVSLMERASEATQLMWLKRKLLQKMGIELSRIDPRGAFLENEKVEVLVERGSLLEGDSIEFVMGRGAGLETPYDIMETDFALEVDPSGRGDFRLEAAVPSLRACGGKPARLDVVAPSIAVPGSEIRVLVRCLDDRGVLTPEFSGRLFISAGPGLEAPSTVIMPDDNEGATWFSARVTGHGVVRIEVRDEDGGLEGESNPVACMDSQYLLLWGDLHTHSIVSDGTQEPSWLYHRARELMGWDFTAVTDHDTWSLGEEHDRSPLEFELMMRAADENYHPGEFVTFRTYEWTNHVLGHRNVLFGPAEEPLFFPHTDPRYSTPEALLGALEGRDVIVVPHHPAWKTHAGEMRFDFGPEGPGVQRLVEVYSRHGSSEYYGCPRPISHVAMMRGSRGTLLRAFLRREYAGLRSGSYVRDALAAGHRLGLIAGSDEHIVGVDPHRTVGHQYGGGTTGLFAAARTREAAWEALKGRRACGTTGVRMLLELRVNGVLQGAELSSGSSPRITGYVLGTADLESVELVKFDSSGYSTPWSGGGSGPESSIDFTDRAFRENSFYYLRVVQADGNMGWAGPTWVDKE